MADIQFKDRKDLYVLRTYIYAAEEYFYWQYQNPNQYVRGLHADRERNRATIFEDKQLADAICTLLNKSQHECGFEVVTVYSAWRCISD